MPRRVRPRRRSRGSARVARACRRRCASTCSNDSSVRSWLLPLGIADEPGAAADQRDRRVPGPLQARQRHASGAASRRAGSRPWDRSRHTPSRARGRTAPRASRRWCRTHPMPRPLADDARSKARNLTSAARLTILRSMGISRRDALKALVASGVGLGTGTLAYGMAYERHDLRLRARRRCPVTGLPLALDGLRVGLITDIHHSEIGVRRRRVARRGAAAGEPAGSDRAGRRLRLVRRPALRRAGRRAAGAARARPLRLLRRAGQPRRRSRDAGGAAAAGASRCSAISAPAWRSGARRSISPASASGRDGPPTWRACSAAPAARPSCSRTIRGASPRRRRSTSSSCCPGHTHGGQVLLPGVGAIAGRKFPVLAGTGREGNATVFVSRGVGTVYVPVRINCPPEVAVLTLQ